MTIKTGAHARWDCRYHLVWSPKYRKDLFSDERLRQCCLELFRDIAVGHKCEVEAMEIAADHVHLLITIPPKLAVADAVRALKSISAREKKQLRTSGAVGRRRCGRQRLRERKMQYTAPFDPRQRGGSWPCLGQRKGGAFPRFPAASGASQ